MYSEVTLRCTPFSNLSELSLHENVIDCSGAEGAFWQHESYDHVIRNGPELGRIVRYILDNPVAAGLCKNWEDWPWTYVKAGILEMFPGW